MISNVGEKTFIMMVMRTSIKCMGYMCKDNVTFDKAIEALNLNYKDAVANERDIQIRTSREKYCNK